jgi:hypothetical protein
VARIYLDVSCLNRPSDDQQLARIRLETEAISIIIERFEEGRWLHLASDMTVIEINANKNAKRRRQALSLLPDRAEIAPLNEAIWSRGMECRNMGFTERCAKNVALESLKRSIFGRKAASFTILRRQSLRNAQ